MTACHLKKAKEMLLSMLKQGATDLGVHIKACI